MVRSSYPDVDIPRATVYDYLFGSLTDADRHRTAMVDAATGAATRYGELVDRINAVAAELARRGVKPGDVVGLHCPNSTAFAIVFHGALRAGATVTPINSLYTADEIARQLADCSATWLFSASALADAAAEAADTAGIPWQFAAQLVEESIAAAASSSGAGAGGARAPGLDIDPATHLAVLPYSSGTTGLPKGVMLSHRNLVANVVQCEALIGLERDDRVLAVLPFFHIYGLTVLLNFALSARAQLVTLPRFELEPFLDAIGKNECTWVFIAPPIAVALAKHPLVDRYDTSSVKVIFSGAAPLDGALATAVARRLDCKVRQGYGMTELSPVSHAVPASRDDLPMRSVGLALPNMECRLVHPGSGADIPVPATGTSRPGELLCRGPNVMLGYLNNPEATAEAIDADGWLRTGDIATVSAEGVYAIVDRLKELIKYKGYQVAPAVLEAVLLGHPRIADAAVIGIPDDDGQEVPKAFVVLQADAALTGDEVMDYVSARVAPHEKVRRVEFIDAIPKSTSGKILRKDLRASERVSAAEPTLRA